MARFLFHLIRPPDLVHVVNLCGELPSGELPGGELPSGELPGGELPSGELPGGELPGGGLPNIAAFPAVKGWLDEDLEYYHLKELRCSTQCHTQMSMWIISRGVVLLILLMEYKFQVWNIGFTSPSDRYNSRENTRSKLEYKFQDQENSEDIFSSGSALEDFICVVFVPDRNIKDLMRSRNTWRRSVRAKVHGWHDPSADVEHCQSQEMLPLSHGMDKFAS
ncbi:hypothetical protein Tco_1485093 [Tanacetum coccineum]